MHGEKSSKTSFWELRFLDCTLYLSSSLQTFCPCLSYPATMPESSNLSCWSGTWPTEQFPGLTQDLLHHCQSVLATSALMWQLSLDLLLLCFLFSCAVPSVDDYVAPTSCHLGLLPVGQPPHAAPWQVAHFSLQKAWEAATCVLPRSPTFHSGTCMVLIDFKNRWENIPHQISNEVFKNRSRFHRTT